MSGRREEGREGDRKEDAKQTENKAAMKRVVQERKEEGNWAGTLFKCSTKNFLTNLSLNFLTILYGKIF